MAYSRYRLFSTLRTIHAKPRGKHPLSEFKSSTYQNVETAVSKIMPGGFLRQVCLETAKVYGSTPLDLAYALSMGFGNGLGVGLGHVSYYALKKYSLRLSNQCLGTDYKDEINIKGEAQKAILLAIPAFVSGSVWQPAYNFMQYYNYGFLPTFLATGFVCSSILFFTLRYGSRTFLPSYLTMLASRNNEHLKSDRELAIKIAFAAGSYVGINATIEGNFVKPFLSVPTDSSLSERLIAAIRAPGSGFVTGGIFTSLFQSIRNKNNDNDNDTLKQDAAVKHPKSLQK